MCKCGKRLTHEHGTAELWCSHGAPPSRKRTHAQAVYCGTLRPRDNSAENGSRTIMAPLNYGAPTARLIRGKGLTHKQFTAGLYIPETTVRKTAHARAWHR